MTVFNHALVLADWHIYLYMSVKEQRVDAFKNILSKMEYKSKVYIRISVKNERKNPPHFSK